MNKRLAEDLKAIMLNIMSDQHLLTDVRSDLLHRFYSVVEENFQDLEGAMKNGRVSTIAWLARNILELSIWTMYCSESEENAKEFVLDSARDVHDALNVPDGMFSKEFSFRTARRENIERTRQDGFETLDDSYSSVSNIAKSLGKGEEFKYLNKLFSKYAHPTALAIVGRDAETVGKVKEKFYMIGSAMARELLLAIETKLR